MAWLRNATLILLATAALMGVALADRRPSVFTDTIFYYAQGEAAAAALGLGRTRDPAGVADPSSVVENDRRPAPTELDTYVGARSAVYGLALFEAIRAGGLWLAAALQSFVAALVLFIAMRAFAPARTGVAYAGAVGVLAAGSSLPFLTAFAMPDLFGGLGALAAITLMAAERPGPASTAVLWAILAFSVCCHDAFPPMVLAVLAAGAVLAWRRLGPGVAVRRALPVAAALALAPMAGWAWSAGHAAVSGHVQHRPPFLAARVLADGPGRSYLRTACARDARRFTLCRFRDRDLADSEAFLWADDPRRGVFTPADVPTRLAIEREEPDFVLHAFAAHPLAEARAAAEDAGRQLVTAYVDDPLVNPATFAFSRFFGRTRITRILPGGAACGADLPGCATPLARAFGLLKLVHLSLALAALAFVGWRLTRREAAAATAPDIAAAAWLVFVAIVANAVICGVASGPFARYGARMIWLLPWLAVILAARLGPWAVVRRAAVGVTAAA